MSVEYAWVLVFRSDPFITHAEKTTLIWKKIFVFFIGVWSEHSVLLAQYPAIPVNFFLLFGTNVATVKKFSFWCNKLICFNVLLKKYFSQKFIFPKYNTFLETFPFIKQRTNFCASSPFSGVFSLPKWGLIFSNRLSNWATVPPFIKQTNKSCAV